MMYWFEKESEARIKEAQAATLAATQANCCPRCDGSVSRNLALTGWVQCDQFGSVGFRKDDTRPACGWQGFIC